MLLCFLLSKTIARKQFKNNTIKNCHYTKKNIQCRLVIAIIPRKFVITVLKPGAFFLSAIFKDTPIQQTLPSGTSAIVKCSAVGTPKPQFDEWKKDGNKTLDKGRFTHMSNGNLRVYPVRSEDQGNYTCAMKQNKGDRRVTTKFRIIHVSVVGK